MLATLNIIRNKIPVAKTYISFVYRNYSMHSTAYPIKTCLFTQSMGMFSCYTNAGTLCGILFQPSVILKSFSNFPSVYDKVKGSSTDPADGRKKPEQEEGKTKSDLEKWLHMNKFCGAELPENITDDQMNTLLEKYQQSIFQARKYLRFLLIVEKEKLYKLQGKLERRQEKVTRYEEQRKLWAKLENCDDHIIYGLWKHSMFGKISRRTLSRWDYCKLSNALQFGQPLVIDCGFDCHKTDEEFSLFGRQMQLSIKRNKENVDPFNLCICNASEDRLNVVKTHADILSDPALPMNITTKSYLELFPKENLVYLTPNSRNVMKTFDHKKVYIIGGVVDYRDHKPVTLAKAIKEGIATMKLPIEKYLGFKTKKTFEIHTMVAILLELQKSGDFQKAFDYIPKHLLRNPDSKFGESPWDMKTAQRKRNEHSALKNKRVFSLSTIM